MINNLTNSVWSTNTLDLTWILTSVLNASFFIKTVIIISAPYLTMTTRDASFPRGTTRMREARQHTFLVDALFSNSTFIIVTTEQSALSIDTGLVIWAVFTVPAKYWNPEAGTVRVRITTEAWWTSASRAMINHFTEWIRTTVESIAWIFAHILTTDIWQACCIGPTVLIT